MEQKYDVFISYSRRDLQQVIGIRDELKELSRVDSWIDLKGICRAKVCFRKAVKQGYEEARKYIKEINQ